MTDVADLEQAARDLGVLMARAAALIAQPDQDRGSAPQTRSILSSRPPWNPAVAAVFTDADAGIRQLESEMRREASGTTRRLSARAGNTGAALDAIAAMGTAVRYDTLRLAVRQLHSWARGIRQLPAVDEALQWKTIQAACEFCRCLSLKLAPAAGLVACANPDCLDEEGRRRTGRLDISRLDGSPVIVWGGL